jgi:hypothetical protein
VETCAVVVVNNFDEVRRVWTVVRVVRRVFQEDWNTLEGCVYRLQNHSPLAARIFVSVAVH